MDKHVIHVDDQPSFVDEVLESMIHVCLEGGGGVAESEEHDCGLVETKRGREGGFPAVFRTDEDVIVSPLDVEFCEDLTSFQFVYQFGYEGKGIGVFGGMGV